MQRTSWLSALIALLLVAGACGASDAETATPEASTEANTEGGVDEDGADENAVQDSDDADSNTSDPDTGSQNAGAMEANGITVTLLPELDADADSSLDAQLLVVGRTNVQSSGNRYLPGSLDLGSAPTTTDLPFVAVWTIPLDDGTVVVVGEDGSAASVSPDQTITNLAPVDPTVAPLATRSDGEIVLTPSNDGVDSDLPDASEAEFNGVRAWFDGATERVPHGALGDTIESTRLIIVNRLVNPKTAGDQLVTRSRTIIDLENEASQSVFEGLAPLLADVDGDGVVDIVTTISDRETGARLAVFDTDGTLIAESDAIGQGNRWRHQIAVAPTGPNGEVEVIEVQTPHIGGLLQFQRFADDALALQHQVGEFRSHLLGSRNMDGAVVFDANGDGRPDVVVPTQDLGAVAIVGSVPTDGGSDAIDLNGATVSSNLALVETEAGLLFTFATSDGSLMVWGA